MTLALLPTLEVAVPLYIAEFAHASEADRTRIAEESADEVATRGDVLQFGGRGCAEAFDALARGLAAAAYQPGGITYAGTHWCVNHQECREAEEAA